MMLVTINARATTATTAGTVGIGITTAAVTFPSINQQLQPALW
jgi:hypothetical protein